MKKILLSALLLLLLPGTTQAMTIGPGHTFTIHFDLSAETPAPPYGSLDYVLYFFDSNKLDIGEGYTVRVFDSGGNPASDEENLIWGAPWTEPTTGIVHVILMNPVPGLADGIGSIVFTDVTGSFDLDTDYCQVRGQTTSGFLTDWVFGETAVFPVPAPTSVFLLGSGLFMLAGLKRRYKK